MAWLVYIEQSKLAVIYFSNSIAVRSIRLDVAEGIREYPDVRLEGSRLQPNMSLCLWKEEKTG